MIDHQLIPSGFCACGCGEKTNLASQTFSRLNVKAGEPFKFIKGHNSRGENHPFWRGGASLIYPKVRAVGHPRANRGSIREHVLLAEKALGKQLPSGAEVHHSNGKKSGGILVICQDRAYHMLLHRRMEALKTCGNKTWRKCQFCQQYDDPKNLYISPKGRQVRHRSCGREYNNSQHKIRQAARGAVNG